jgi:hypothetical protein
VPVYFLKAKQGYAARKMGEKKINGYVESAGMKFRNKGSSHVVYGHIPAHFEHCLKAMFTY